MHRMELIEWGVLDFHLEIGFYAPPCISRPDLSLVTSYAHLHHGQPSTILVTVCDVAALRGCSAAPLAWLVLLAVMEREPGLVDGFRDDAVACIHICIVAPHCFSLLCLVLQLLCVLQCPIHHVEQVLAAHGHDVVMAAQPVSVCGYLLNVHWSVLAFSCQLLRALLAH